MPAVAAVSGGAAMAAVAAAALLAGAGETRAALEMYRQAMMLTDDPVRRQWLRDAMDRVPR